MSIYLRSTLSAPAPDGDTVGLDWYCSEGCYSTSLMTTPATATFEVGGRYPGGAESDSPDYCAACGDAVGNPLTAEGEQYVRELLREGTSLACDTLREVYPWLIPSSLPGEDRARRTMTAAGYAAWRANHPGRVI